MIKFVKPVTALVLALAVPAWAQQPALPEIELKIGSQVIAAEVAANDPTRQQGLMYRRIMAENRGMLFVFRDTAYHAMWMQNTYLPLSVAFIDTKGVIVNIEDMQPQTTDTHPAKAPVKYALEMNQGWFKKRGIKPGAKIEGLDRAPLPQ
ncbi:MAG: DUF192 domain-containing protein [Burkholderiales bacterium]